MNDQLAQVAQAIVAPGKGILAADESTGTIKKRFDTINTESTEDSRRDYREMLFRTTDAMKNHISGVILYDETLRQNAKDGTPLAQVIADTGAFPGIKVDMGPKALPFCAGETVTQGLTGLRERIADYVELGARFAKWRAVINIGGSGNAAIPSHNSIHANAHALARYAALCQEGGLVPIVEPEIMMDGDHDINACYAATEWVLKEVYQELFYAKVTLEGTILKPNMVLCGSSATNRAGIEEVAEKTVRCLKASVPAAVPGICFLSGGQSDEDATAHLSAMNAGFDLPWGLSFSYGRALQHAALNTWGGKSENVAAAQAAFAHRARMNSLAAQGEWNKASEKEAA